MSLSWSKYYTPSEVALELLNLLPYDFIPTYAIDICMGQGNFLNACKFKWPNINLIGSDIEINDSQSINSISTFKLDALDISNLKYHFTISPLSKNLIVANPPFGRIARVVPHESKYDELFNQASILKRIEAYMLISNLSLMKEGDYFAAVLPENFFTSIKFDTFKNSFLSNFNEIHLSKPLTLFSGSEVKTRFFIGEYTEFKKAKPLFSQKNGTSKISNKYSLFRGFDNSKLKKVSIGLNHYHEVLHFSNSNGDIINKRYIEKHESQERLLVTEGDILILRVGRNAGLIFLANSKYIGKLISDYFYILRDHQLSISQIGQLQKKLMYNINGVTTKYLTKHNIEQSIDLIN